LINYLSNDFARDFIFHRMLLFLYVPACNPPRGQTNVTPVIISIINNL
jgi:hypothetical protein